MLTSPCAEAAVAPIDSATLVKTTAASAWAASRRIPVREAIPRSPGLPGAMPARKRPGASSPRASSPRP